MHQPADSLGLELELVDSRVPAFPQDAQLAQREGALGGEETSTSSVIPGSGTNEIHLVSSMA